MTYPEGKIKGCLMEPAHIRLLFGLCWMAYFSTYLGRLNYTAGLTEIIRSEGFSKASAGLIGTGFFLAYGVGQLINGFMGDKLKPQNMIFAGLIGSALMNFCMVFLSNPLVMMVIWCINGFVQSLIWSPIVKLFSEWIPVEKQKHACVNINSSVPIGTLAAYFMTALLIYLISWRAVFFSSGVILSVVSVVWYIGITKLESKVVAIKEPTTVQNKRIEIQNKASISIIKLFALSGIIFCCFALMMQGVLKDGVTTWIPTYISEVFHLNSATSIISTTLIPIFNLGGVYLAAIINKKFFPNEVSTCVFFFTICMTSLILLRISPDNNLAYSLILFAVATTSMMAVNTMFVSVIPIYFAPYGKASTMSGILNSSAYLGGAISTFGIGALSTLLGWNTTIVIWIGCACLGIFICIMGRKKWNEFICSERSSME